MNFIKKPKKPKTSAPVRSQMALLGGSYSLVISAVVLALLIVVNLFVSALPTSMTKYDISSTKLYSITSNTKVVVNALEEDVTIYWIVQAGQEDDVIENLLGKYESLSDHITVVKRNPDVYPTFAEQYTDEEVPNNSLVVESGDRYRYISYNDIYLSDTNMYSYSYSTSFDGEGAITSAIDYVVTEDLPQLYVLEGHGEAELPSTFSDQLEKENYEVNTLSLLTVDQIPEEADCVLIYAPSTDLSEEEVNMLRDYVADGGKLMVSAGTTENGSLPNLYSLLGDYGVTAAEGIVVEGDREHYAFGMPYVLMPDIASSDITDSLTEENYYVLMPISQGMTRWHLQQRHRDLAAHHLRHRLQQGGRIQSGNLREGGRRHRRSLHRWPEHRGQQRRPDRLVQLLHLPGGYVQRLLLRRQCGHGHELPVLAGGRTGGHCHPLQVAEL